MKFAALAFTLFASATQAYEPTTEEKNDCKMYELCCDDNLCLNNCATRPACDFDHPTIADGMNPAFGEILCQNHFGYQCCRDSCVSGDPHFQTWSGEHFDFHGECDMTFVHAPSFGHGLGLDVQIRATMRSDYSYIESAAIRIGNDDILEVSSWGQFSLNGVDGVVEEHNDSIGHLASFDVKYEKLTKYSHRYTIPVGDGENIVIKTFKSLVAVKFEGASPDNYRDSTGILGDFLTGKKFARDGYTIMEDTNAFGQEWQVTPEDPKLFYVARAPQLADGQKCRMPAVTADGRRLGESKVSEEVAAEACAEWHDEFKQSCIYDVMATGDLDLADAGAM